MQMPSDLIDFITFYTMFKRVISLLECTYGAYLCIFIVFERESEHEQEHQ